MPDERQLMIIPLKGSAKRNFALPFIMPDSLCRDIAYKNSEKRQGKKRVDRLLYGIKRDLQQEFPVHQVLFA